MSLVLVRIFKKISSRREYDNVPARGHDAVLDVL